MSAPARFVHLSHGTVTVLVVDPDLAVRDRIVEAVERRGWSALAAGNATEAIRELESAQCDGIITEALLPDLQGSSSLFDFIELEQPWLLPNLVLHTSAPAATAEMIARHYHVAFVAKPAPGDEVVEAFRPL